MLAFLMVAALFILFTILTLSQYSTGTYNEISKEDREFIECRANNGGYKVGYNPENEFDTQLTCSENGTTLYKDVPEDISDGVIQTWSETVVRLNHEYERKSAYTYMEPNFNYMGSGYTSPDVDPAWTPALKGINGDLLRYSLIYNLEKLSLEQVLTMIRYNNEVVPSRDSEKISVNGMTGYRLTSDGVTYYLLKHTDTAQILLYRYGKSSEKTKELYEKIIYSTKFNEYD